jgi:ferredoxin
MRGGRQPGPSSGSRDHLLTVDWTRCAGHGVCAAALGERVGLDQWGYPTVGTGGTRVPTKLLGAARMAVAACPAAALRLRPAVDPARP